MNLANEGLEARMKDAEVAGKKRKAEDDKLWEGASLPFLHRHSQLMYPRRIKGPTCR